jgi:hypothetical protein
MLHTRLKVPSSLCVRARQPGPITKLRFERPFRETPSERGTLSGKTRLMYNQFEPMSYIQLCFALNARWRPETCSALCRPRVIRDGC